MPWFPFFAHDTNLSPNATVSDRSQPPLTYALFVSEAAGSDSLHRLVRPLHLPSLAGGPPGETLPRWYPASRSPTHFPCLPFALTQKRPGLNRLLNEQRPAN